MLVTTHSRLLTKRV